jgi:hypothetical protein
MVPGNVHFKVLITSDLQITSLSWHPVCLYLRRSKVNPEGKTMKNISKTILAVLATGLISCALFTQQAQAVPTTLGPINGAITFSGGVELDSITVNTASMVIGWLDQHGFMPTVTSGSGSFMGLNGSTATFVAPWRFNTPPGPPIPGFWSVGGFTFDLATSHIVSQGGGFLTVSGSGTTSGNGFDPTAMNWSFSTQDPPAGQPPVFSFSASSNTIPDSGSTVALLGLVIVGVEALRRKMRAV